MPIISPDAKLPETLTLDEAAAWTGRERNALRRLYQRGVLKSCGVDAKGRVVFPFFAVCRLGSMREPAPGRPSELLAA